MSLITTHFENDYFVSIKAIKHIPGLILELPKNLIKGTESTTFTYEIYDGKVIIYESGKVKQKVDCPAYAARYLINSDVSLRVLKYGLLLDVIKFFDVDGNHLKYEDVVFIELIQAPESLEDRAKEAVLKKYIANNLDEDEEIPADIVEGYEAVAKHYSEEAKHE